MARSKLLRKEAPKKIASKSAVPKNGRRNKPSKVIRQHKATPEGIPKRRTKVTAQQKAKKKSGGPLAAAFSASLDASRAFLEQQAKASITATHQDFLQQIVTLNTQFEKEAQAISKSNEGIQKPLDQHQLHFIGKDGKSAGTQSLGDRMKKFRDFVAVEKKKINDLGKEWAEINQSIMSLALEMVGPEGFGDLSSHLNGELPDYAVPRDKAFEEEAERKVDGFKSEIANVNDTMIHQMETYEEELKDARRKQMASLLSVMAAEI